MAAILLSLALWLRKPLKASPSMRYLLIWLIHHAIIFNWWQMLAGRHTFPSRKTQLEGPGGSALWKKMYHYFQLNRDEFMEHYHKRSNIEATNAAIKRKFGETLKSKNPTAQVNELLAKIIAYNLTVVIHEMYENGINPEFLHLEQHSL